MKFFILPVSRITACAGAVMTLCACATTQSSVPQRVIVTESDTPTKRELFTRAVADTGRSIPGAARAPLKDFNLMRDSIPAVLTRIEYPYQINGPVYCDKLVQEVTALDEVLGVSHDIHKDELSRSEATAEAASNAAQNALEDVATGWIPYRSVVRRITGATKHERSIRKAYERGRIRRAFLKGVGGAFQCPYPARPLSVIKPMPMDNGSE